jgi:hypothetical protein
VFPFIVGGFVDAAGLVGPAIVAVAAVGAIKPDLEQWTIAGE